ncbi:MAG TPA: hypothetical protein PKE47_12340, partial [Verrucomicrobiota bacterium]|nr:hypothetical protein [Verrucomicrobiota bacterium]
MNFPSNFFVPPPLKLPAYRPLPGTAWFRAQCGLGVFLFLTAKTTVLQQVLAPMTDRIGRPGAAYPGHLGLLLLAALTAGLMGFVLAMAGWINWMSWQSEKRRLVRQGGEAAVRIDRSPAPHPV